jgi:hypothetical protein
VIPTNGAIDTKQLELSPIVTVIELDDERVSLKTLKVNENEDLVEDIDVSTLKYDDALAFDE